MICYFTPLVPLPLVPLPELEITVDESTTPRGTLHGHRSQWENSSALRIVPRHRQRGATTRSVLAAARPEAHARLDGTCHDLDGRLVLEADALAHAIVRVDDVRTGRVPRTRWLRAGCARGGCTTRRSRSSSRCPSVKGGLLCDGSDRSSEPENRRAIRQRQDRLVCWIGF